MIRAVTFDFWDTLYKEDPAVLHRRRDRQVAMVQGFFSAAGRPVECQAIRTALNSATVVIDGLRRREHRNLSRPEIGQLIARELGFELNPNDAEVLAEIVSVGGVQYPPAPADGAGLLLSRLRGRVGMAVISDTALTLGTQLRETMASHGLAEFFSQFTWSDETLTTKPSARQFLYTLHMLGASPGEAVHVGDLEDTDVAGAKAVGMRCIRIMHGDAVEQTGVNTAADAAVWRLPDVADVLKDWGLDV
jgi:FMN hydrolase / 5-amino-6-(5-phospho-D-ribitylamino)uracil phosphatase